MQLNTQTALHTLALVLVATGLLSGCGGSDGAPPLSGVTTNALDDNQSKNQEVTGGGSNASSPTGGDAFACSEEGVTEACRTPITARDGFYLCGQGQRSCQGGHWSTCETKETSAGVDQWTPITVGCDVPAERCAREGEGRTCVQYLPASGPSENNCYHGEQRCQSGAWSTCMPFDK
jgi:hypothetical protein